MYPQMMVRFGQLILLNDMNYPTLTWGGSTSGQGTESHTLTPQYRGMGLADDGSSDPRDKTSTARQVMFVLGRHALCELFPEKFHWEWEYEIYDKYFGSGVFLGYGHKAVAFNTSVSPDSTTLQCRGSKIVAFSQPPRD
jgi:hypothetical protein